MRNSIRLLAVAVLCLIACNRGSEVTLDRFAEEVQRKLAANDATPVPLADFTDFSWEQVYIFPPYTPPGEVTRAVGSTWDAARTGIEYRDDAALLVFVRGGEVVAWSMYPLGAGDLSKATASDGLAQAVARFTVRQEDQLGTPWVVLDLAAR